MKQTSSNSCFSN